MMQPASRDALLGPLPTHQQLAGGAADSSCKWESLSWRSLASPPGEQREAAGEGSHSCSDQWGNPSPKAKLNTPTEKPADELQRGLRQCGTRDAHRLGQEREKAQHEPGKEKHAEHAGKREREAEGNLQETPCTTLREPLTSSSKKGWTN